MNALIEQEVIEQVKAPTGRARWIAVRSIHSNAIGPRAVRARSVRATSVRTAGVDRAAALEVIEVEGFPEVVEAVFGEAVAGVKGVSGAIP